MILLISISNKKKVGDDSNSVIDGLGDDSNSNTQTKPSLPRNNKKQKHEEEKEDDEDNLDEEDCLDEEDGSEGDLDGGDGVYDEEDDDDDPVLVKKAGKLLPISQVISRVFFFGLINSFLFSIDYNR